MNAQLGRLGRALGTYWPCGTWGPCAFYPEAPTHDLGALLTKT